MLGSLFKLGVGLAISPIKILDAGVDIATGGNGSRQGSPLKAVTDLTDDIAGGIGDVFDDIL
ncbi:MAG: hypothetical protein IPM06_18745 [Rhizobiales bacterium]|nr:hypothetical protein [Hyphomicrobiales bacterium]